MSTRSRRRTDNTGKPNDGRLPRRREQGHRRYQRAGVRVRGPAPDEPPAQIVDAWRARLFTLVTSEHILTELTRTFTQPYFRPFLTPQEAADIISLLRSRAVVTAITVAVRGVATHPEDDLVLATAVSAGADYLVTGDRQLQQLGRFLGVTIVSPRRFAELLVSEREGRP